MGLGMSFAVGMVLPFVTVMAVGEVRKQILMLLFMLTAVQMLAVMLEALITVLTGYEVMGMSRALVDDIVKEGDKAGS